MLKLITILLSFLIFGDIFSQGCVQCNPFLFTSNFLFLKQEAVRPQVLHYTSEVSYKPETNPKKISEDDNYIHNGNNLKGAQDLFIGNSEGLAWIRNFDFGKIANVVFEVNGDTHYGSGGSFEWTGTLAFLKLFKKRSVGNIKAKRQKPRFEY